MKQILTKKTKALMGIKADTINSAYIDQEADSLDMVMKDPVNAVQHATDALRSILDDMPEGFDIGKLHMAITNYAAVNSRLQDAVRMVSDELRNAAADLRKTESN